VTVVKMEARLVLPVLTELGADPFGVVRSRENGELLLAISAGLKEGDQNLSSLIKKGLTVDRINRR
jgi:hypothetical protein